MIVFTIAAHVSAREVIVLDTAWLFHRGDITYRYECLDDLSWEQVCVPHDWAIAGPFDLNEDMQFVKVIEDGDTAARLRTGRTGALPATGVGWYRREIWLDKSVSDRRLYVEFDGVMSNAKVYFNGYYIGNRPYGYSSFSFDVSDYACFGGKNYLDVRVENLPESSRFYTGAGIYRPVRMVLTHPVHVAEWGTYITTPEISKKQGRVSIATTVKSLSEGNNEVKLITSIYAPSGHRVAQTESSHRIKNEYTFSQTCNVRKPLLWDTDTPHLYTAVSSVWVDGVEVDRYTTRFGFRTIRFDKDKGFFLNEKQTKIKGVCLHHDLGPLGAAVNRRATERQLQIMKEMGCNAIRTAHNPSSIELLQLCDSLGLMVQVEAFDEWRNGKCANGYNLYFDEWAERDLVGLIHRDRNHPCVIMWSIGNELREQGEKEGWKVAKYLNDIAHREDPTRPTTAGYNNHWAAIDNGLADAVDLVGFNYKHFDYVTQHEKHPDYILYGSETASAVSSRGVYKFPVCDNWTPWYNDYQVSSYDMEYVPWGSAPDTEFEKQDDNEFLLGEFVWTGFDYLGEPSPYGEGAPSRSSYFGIVDLAGLPKDRYYLYSSRWSDKPVLHLMPHWNWPDRVGLEVPVQCYTNYPVVELFVNGVSHGKCTNVKNDKFRRYRMRWDDVIYHPGEIKVVAYNANGIACEERVVKTAGNPSQIRLSLDRDTLTADGKDLAFITVDVCDEAGNLCPRDASMLFVKVSGNGRLRAMCNGDATDLTSFASNYMRVFNGKLVLIIEAGRDSGNIEVMVSGERLNAATCKLTTIKP
ncbi:MAG: DUF4982 domain-containing protein [Coprobacter sp.]|nr:DUF4982 domain-containing protein [Coprobacter sp.]